jgi:hypothetical protein
MVESISSMITFTSDEAVLVPDPFWAGEPPGTYGSMTLLEVGIGRVKLLTTAEGQGTADPALVARLTRLSSRRASGTWVWLAEAPPRYPTEEQLLAAARSAYADLFAGLRHDFATRRFRDKRADHWIGITFMDEGPERGQTRRAWVFMELRLKDIQKPPIVRSVVEAHPLTAGSRALRTPELIGLDDAHVAVVGAGSIGAPLALELVKAGVGAIDVIDHDIYEAGQSVRHVLPVTSASHEKAMAVAASAELMNPLVTVTSHQRKIRGDNADRLLAGAELVIDTTGSQAVGRMLSRSCRELGKTLIVVGLSNGAWGGDLVILRPNGPCFMCFTLHQGAGEIPSPRAGSPSNRTATGCAHPAFSGSGFDATELAAIAARAAVGSGGWCAYPAPEYDWLVVNFRAGATCESGRLEPWPGCPVCGAA